MSNYQICFIGNAIVDIISEFSDENLKELKIPKGSMQLIDEKSSNLILDYLNNFLNKYIIFAFHIDFLLLNFIFILGQPMKIRLRTPIIQ